jgi:16S rRNA (uracil1498-N3)-methyltransferase
MDLRHTHRIFVSPKLAAGVTINPCDEHAHHLIHVLRMKAGDALRLFNGRDGEWRGSVAAVAKKSLDITIEEQVRPQATEPDLWLCPAPIKKAHFDFMLEKATELGVSEIQPILTHRTQIRDVNGDRAHILCTEAAQQSDRLSVPAVGRPVDLGNFIEVFPADRALIVCAEWGDATPVRDALTTPALRAFAKAAIVTGPEGGFAAEELDKLRKIKSAFFVRLGPRILRADTAAIAALTCWQALQGDWS